MLISLCIPIMNRLDDFKETIGSHVSEALASPPVEIVVLDYNSTDGLNDYMKGIMGRLMFTNESRITHKKYSGRDTYHAAHANNLAMLAGKGDWVVLVPADVFTMYGYVAALRNLIDIGYQWANTDKKRRSTIAINKDEFIYSGGYDERFECYGPDDVDLIERLERRGLKRGAINDNLLRDIFTSPEKKIANYRLKGSHVELGQALMPFLYDNRSRGQLVGNKGRIWGQW